MQLRDEGVLALTDRLERWLPGSRHAHLTVRDLLVHASGLQREPVGRIWESLEAPGRRTCSGAQGGRGGARPPHRVALLQPRLHPPREGHRGRDGHAVGGCRPQPRPRPPGHVPHGSRPTRESGHGFSVPPHDRTARREPRFELRAVAPLGGLWSSVADLARYAAFVADPDERVLAPATLDETCRTVIKATPGGGPATGSTGCSSGTATGSSSDTAGDARVRHRSRGRPRHRGRGRRPRQLDRGGGPDGPRLAARRDRSRGDPVAEEAWEPEPTTPAWVDLLGSWWMEGSEVVLEVRDGELWSRAVGSEHRRRPVGASLGTTSGAAPRGTSSASCSRSSATGRAGRSGSTSRRMPSPGRRTRSPTSPPGMRQDRTPDGATERWWSRRPSGALSGGTGPVRRAASASGCGGSGTRA